MTHARSLIAALALTTLPLAVHAQTVCGSWEELAFFPSVGRIADMVAFDDGAGVQLYIAGSFLSVRDPVQGSVEAWYLARWDGAAWSAVPGIDAPDTYLFDRAIELEVWDDGTGPALYVAGAFDRAAGRVANGLARWDGTTWSVLGDPATAGLEGQANAIIAHDFGDGEKLYIGGDFRYPSGGGNAPNVFSWDGAAWAPVPGAPETAAVYTLASFGGDLYASGPFDVVEGDNVSNILRFDGGAWTIPLGDGQRIVGTEMWPLLPWAIDGRDVLVAAGQFRIEEGGAIVIRSIATWDGTRWNGLPGAPLPILPGQQLSLATFDDGTGEALFLGSSDSRSGFQSVRRWKDGRFGPVVGLDGSRTFALAVFDDGDGPALFAGGEDYGFARWRPAPCAADLTGDCTLDLFDFLEFQNLFDAGDVAADFDGDGALTIFDFLAYQNVFDAGCV